jgi:hypothetical protein
MTDGVLVEPEGGLLEKCVSEALEEIGRYLPVLKQKAERIVNTRFLGVVPRRMVEAATAVDGATLTPMAAVAGAVSDVLKVCLQKAGAEYVSVNNGGDIAIFTALEQTVRVGIGDSEKGRTTPYVLALKGPCDCGVATSGFGGRSFTLGLADAAATYIGNMTNTGAKGVTRKRAVEIDPSTDIPDEWVTVAIGELSPAEIGRALESGLTAARDLERRGVILGAVILLKGRMVTTLEGKENMNLEVLNGCEKDHYHR